MELLEFAGSDLGVQDDRGLDRFNRVEVVVLVELVDEGILLEMIKKQPTYNSVLKLVN